MLEAPWTAVGQIGPAYAALRIGSKQIVDNSIRSQDIRTDEVSSSDVRDFSLRSRDFQRGQLPAGREGPAGRAGPQGIQGPAGTAAPMVS